MLGKLYITPTSTLEKLQSVYDLITEAVELKIAPDAACRTALTKSQLALGRAIGEAPQTRRKSTVPEGATILESEATRGDRTQLVEAGEEDVDVKVEDIVEEGTNLGDSIVDELLEDDEEL